MRVSSRGNPWLRSDHPNPNSRKRLFCFPNLGSSAESFLHWSNQAQGIEVFGVQLPGHGRRHEDLPMEEWQPLLSQLALNLAPSVTVESAFFGEGLGCLLAFETARELRRLGVPLPQTLFMHGWKPPQDRSTEVILESDVFSVMEFLNLPETSVFRTELTAGLLALPVIRKDLALFSKYSFRQEEPLDCGIHCFAGADDPIAPPGAMEGWAEQTSRAFRLEVVEEVELLNRISKTFNA